MFAIGNLNLMQMKTTKAFLLIVCALLPFIGKAGNEKISVAQVADNVVVSANVDYVVTSAAPFADGGTVNITNLDHAVLILERVKPTAALSLLKDHVQIDGQVAQNGVTCQVRRYGSKGCMVLPYVAGTRPLTVYSEQNFGGESANDFGLENDGGYMNTLTDAKLNNRIRSFKLKRGYMVTFSTRPGGRGYSRCFIANNADLELAELPLILDQRISSYRIFKWNTVGKAGLANNTGTAASALNVVSCYNFGLGNDTGLDIECVPHHIYEDWPSSSACGKVTYSAHLKTNNEPGNSADDKPQDLNTILNNWPNLMRTGMRLCAPSTHDGSESLIHAFLDSIDARGWRCDIIDLHCYWVESTFSGIKGNWVDRHHRPVWISEWVWGASWNKNGAFASGVTQSQVKTNVQSICTKLNSWDYIERYYYWNSEVYPSKLYDNGLTPAGEWYSTQLTGMGYTTKYEFIPKLPRQYGFKNFHEEVKGGQATISWHDYNGEYNQLMELWRKERGGQWTLFKTIRPEEGEADYAIVDDTYTDGARYRLHLIDLNGREYYSDERIEVGDALSRADGSVAYIGGNVIPNGGFDMDTYGWLSGTGAPIARPLFQVFPRGLTGTYLLQAFANKGMTDAGSLLTPFDVEAGQDYAFCCAGQNGGTYLKVSLTADGKTEAQNVITLNNPSYWATHTEVFNTGTYTQALVAFRWLAAKAQLSGISMCRLFGSREEAVADGVAQERRRAGHIKAYNVWVPAFNEELTQILAGIAGTDDEALARVQRANNDVLQALRVRPLLDSLYNVCTHIDYMDFEGRGLLVEAEQVALQALTRQSARGIIEAYDQLQAAYEAFVSLNVSEVQPTSADFASADGWETKVGTYTGGDQRAATKVGKTCWNAWWANVSASVGDTRSMEVRQTLTGLPEGLYTLQCQALTEHSCITDQHGYLVCGTDTVNTPYLSQDYMDIPNTPTPWQTLTTLRPLHVAEGGSLTMGFVGSKQGATDNLWREYGVATSTGDRREGWWCATDFTLLYHPLFTLEQAAGSYGTVCLPYQYRIPQGVTLYRVAGLSADYQQLCLEEVTEVEPGYPYIYKAEADKATFYTEGEALERPITQGTNNLRGYFQYIGTAAVGTYVLNASGEWERVTGTRPKVGNYKAILTKAAGLDVLDGWQGATMPIHGVTDELGDPTGVRDVRRQDTATEVYDLQGIRRDAVKARGVYIMRQGGKAKVTTAAPQQ